jgi:NADH dehydrogenase/NADH:ubiquinone oxidoreductase subunit G
MGALTLKTFPFELRGWDIEKFESIDPTDGFGSETRVYIRDSKIIQIEPDYNIYSFNTWLTDKGRQFFDGIFDLISNQKTPLEKKEITNVSWSNILKSIMQNIYFFDHCNLQNKNKYFLTIVFENVSLEVLSLLNIISQNHSFIKVKRAENIKLNNDLESSFQLNTIMDKEKLSSSTLCLLISNNPRYEGYQLNLSLRQRILKGNFKCFIVGSMLNLTFPVSFLGSNTKILKSIVEGNNLICQDLKFAKNPLIVFNTEIYKRNDGQNILEMFKILKNSNIFNKSWNGLNILNSSLNEAGVYSTAQFTPLSIHDFATFSSMYFLNTNIENIPELKKIIELKILNLSDYKNDYPNINRLFLDQNYYPNKNISISLANNTQKSTKYLYLPTNMFYENNETFINTEGFIKRTTKLVIRKNTRNNWQILRKFFKSFKKDLTFANNKDNTLIFFNSTKWTQFKTFINFQFYATQNLSNLNYYFKTNNQSFVLYQNKFLIYKKQPTKIFDTKLKYWLDDFFLGGKDEYSQHSVILTNCSKILRTESTNFF